MRSLLVFAILLAIVTLACGAGDEVPTLAATALVPNVDSPSTYSETSVAPTDTIVPTRSIVLTYDAVLRVSGTANSADIYYQIHSKTASTPGTELWSQPLPWQTTLTNVREDRLLQFGANSTDSASKTIRCELIVDGIVISEMENSGPFAFVTCTIVYELDA